MMINIILRLQINFYCKKIRNFLVRNSQNSIVRFVVHCQKIQYTIQFQADHYFILQFYLHLFVKSILKDFNEDRKNCPY